MQQHRDYKMPLEKKNDYKSKDKLPEVSNSTSSFTSYSQTSSSASFTSELDLNCEAPDDTKTFPKITNKTKDSAYLQSVRKRLNVSPRTPERQRPRYTEESDRENDIIAPRSTNDIIFQYSRKNKSTPKIPSMESPTSSRKVATVYNSTPPKFGSGNNKIYTNVSNRHSPKEERRRRLSSKDIPQLYIPSTPQKDSSTIYKELIRMSNDENVDDIYHGKINKDRGFRNTVSLARLVGNENMDDGVEQERYVSPNKMFDSTRSMVEKNKYFWYNSVEKHEMNEDFIQLFPRASKKITQKNLIYKIDSTSSTRVKVKRPSSLPRPKSRGFFEEGPIKRFSEGLAENPYQIKPEPSLRKVRVDLLELPLIREVEGFVVDKDLLGEDDKFELRLQQFATLDCKYTKEYKDKTHYNFIGVDPEIGVTLVSVLKPNIIEDPKKLKRSKLAFESVSAPFNVKKTSLLDEQDYDSIFDKNPKKRTSSNAHKKIDSPRNFLLKRFNSDTSRIKTKRPKQEKVQKLKRTSSEKPKSYKMPDEIDRARARTTEEIPQKLNIEDICPPKYPSDETISIKVDYRPPPLKRTVREKRNGKVKIKSHQKSSSISSSSLEMNLVRNYYANKETDGYFFNEKKQEKRKPHYISSQDESNDDSDSATTSSGSRHYHTHALVRNAQYDIEISFPIKHSNKALKPKDILKNLKLYAPVLSLTNLRFVNGEEVRQKIMNYEDMMSTNQYKFGVIYCKAGQKFEEEMYNNKDPSESFLEFLELLGHETLLLDNNEWSAGLDTTGKDGTHTVSTLFRNVHIVYHVSTMLPYKESPEGQHINKKRHIGNDAVVIVFQEGPRPFSPAFFMSKYNQVFVVVRKINEDSIKRGKPVYKVGVTSKVGVGKFHPRLPRDQKFEHGKEFREWLLLKCINGEKSSYQSAGFKESRSRVKAMILQSILGEALKQKTIEM